MRYLLAGTVLALSLSMALAPAVAQGNLTVMGTGTLSCGAWTAARRDPYSTQARAEQQWILGYIVGISDADKMDPLKGTDPESVSAWIDNYCAANPLKDQIEAARAFMLARTGR